MSKARKDMNPEYFWDLSPIFADQPAWEAALHEADARVAQLAKLPGTLGRSAEDFRAGLEQIAEAAELTERVYTYAALQASVDNGDPAYQEMQERATQLFVRFGTASAFLNPEILSLPPETVDAYMRGPEMDVYRHMIGDISRARAHTLTAHEEEMLAMLGDAAQTPKRAFEMFESVDMRFEDMQMPDGSTQPLTHALFGVYRASGDPAVRRQAFEKYFGEYQKYGNTLSALYAGSVKQDSYYASVRNFGSSLEAALFDGCIPCSLYENLIQSVHRALPLLNRYLEIQKRCLGENALSLFDLYVPIVKNVELPMPYERAQQLVLDALKPLGEEYQSLLKRAFEEKWIDVYESSGKATGAFSSGVYGAHPYVLMNYTGKVDDAFTLAHELGHAMHSWFSDQTQAFVNHDYCIFVAEVASTVNEVLLTRHMLNTETDPEVRRFVLSHLLESFRTTVFRQTLFAEFEKKAHEMYEGGIPLTAQSLNAAYGELNAQYYAAAEQTELANVEWSRIPHFYNAFYVYQYATGFSSAVSIAARILDGSGAESYLRFLQTGGSMYPIDELKIAGVDLTTPQPIDSAMKVFRETLDEFEKLMG